MLYNLYYLLSDCGALYPLCETFIKTCAAKGVLCTCSDKATVLWPTELMQPSV